MSLTPEEREERKRQRMIEKAREYQTSTYARKFVAPVFQKMIRAEWAAKTSPAIAVCDGEIRIVRRQVGQVVCVTCGRVCRWDDKSTINTGHFIPSRRNSILFVEDNVAPQCVACNCHSSGALLEYQQWMEYVRGRQVIADLRRLKADSVTFSAEELVDMRIEYTQRLKAAESLMKGDT